MADKKKKQLKKKLHWDCDTDGYQEPDLLHFCKNIETGFSFIMEETESKHPHI